jgi:hypothetical protein
MMEMMIHIDFSPASYHFILSVSHAISVGWSEKKSYMSDERFITDDLKVSSYVVIFKTALWWCLLGRVNLFILDILVETA